MKTRFVIYGYFIFLLLTCACNDTRDSFMPGQRTIVADSVQLLFKSIARDISNEGPAAWLRYFEETPGFFMASGGRLVFPNNDTATNFIKNVLAKSIRTIVLQWRNIRIDPISKEFAGIGAFFHEDITDATGKKIPVDGYFTGIAHQTPKGWILRNAHWSIIESH